MRTLIVGLAAVIAAAPSAADDSPEAVVKKAVAAHGGADALAKYRAGSAQVKGTMAIPAAEVNYTGEVTYQLPDKFRMALNLDLGGNKLTLVQVANGDAVTTTLNDAPQKLSDAQKAEALQAARMQEVTQLAPLLDAGKFTLKPGKGQDVNGQPTDAVVVSAKGLKEVTLYFDKKSNLLVKTSRKGLAPDEKAVTEETVLGDYKKVSGVMVPMSMTVTHDGKKFMTTAVTEAKLSATADPKLFEAKKE